jgi:hypothetical protein
MSDEGEIFAWDWINARRDKSLTDDQTLQLAPTTSRRWVDGGADVVNLLRRQVATLQTVKRVDQLPGPNSRTARVLDQIYQFYDGRKHRFEALAEQVVEWVMAESGIDYRLGWITPPSPDGGAGLRGSGRHREGPWPVQDSWFWARRNARNPLLRRR